MKFREVKKGMYIINIKTLGSSPWWVANKYTGMVIIRRRPKVGKMVALTTRQLCQFIEIDIRRWNARDGEELKKTEESRKEGKP